jgi:hypothetical protein
MQSPNKIEKNLSSLLNSDFPRYIVFREKYLTPLRGLPSNPNWRNDTHPILEQVGVTAYGILKSINFINHRKSFITISDFDQSFKNIYFHFGLVFDCIESFSRSIILLEKLLGKIDLENKLRISRDELIDKYKEWVDKEYDKKYADLIEKGKPIFYYPQNDHTYLSLFLKNPIKREYNRFSRVIKDYRNFFIHNPGVDIFHEIPTGKLFTIKKENVDLSKNWANIQTLFNIDRSLFENPTNMIQNDLKVLLSILNDIWQFFDSRLDKIYNDKDFNRLFQGYKRVIEY